MSQNQSGHCYLHGIWKAKPCSTLSVRAMNVMCSWSETANKALSLSPLFVSKFGNCVIIFTNSDSVETLRGPSVSRHPDIRLKALVLSVEVCIVCFDVAFNCWKTCFIAQEDAPGHHIGENVVHNSIVVFDGMFRSSDKEQIEVIPRVYLEARQALHRDPYRTPHPAHMAI